MSVMCGINISPFQGLSTLEPQTRGVALGWIIAPLRGFGKRIAHPVMTGRDRIPSFNFAPFRRCVKTFA